MTINAAKCLPRWTNMGIIERKMISLIWDVGHVAVVKLEKKILYEMEEKFITCNNSIKLEQNCLSQIIHVIQYMLKNI